MPRRAWVGFLLATALIFVATGLATLPTSQGAEAAPALAPHVEGEVIVKFKSGVPKALQSNVHVELGIVEVRPLKGIGAEQLKLRDMTVAEALARFKNDPRIEYIEPNYIVSSQALPNDPNFTIQWGLHNVGQTGGDPGADIMAAEAWDVTTGNGEVVVAVIDSGIDYNHPDLAPNVFLNADEIPDNGIDDDNNGFVDDYRGWNFLLQNNDPIDEAGHGTHVAGIVGAVGDNSLGIAGVAWDVKIMGLKFLNSGGLGSTASAVESIHYATLMGVDVINASWGGGAPSQALVDAIREAGEADIVFVAAAGNGNPGVNIDLQPFIPATLDLDNIIAVAASDDRDRLWTNSNFGLNSVDVAAPGVSIYSTFPNGGYAFQNGTSMAAPHVAGAMALLRGTFPALSALEAKELLLDRSDHVDSLVGLVTGGRRLNAFLPIASADETPPAMIDTLSTFNPESSRIDVSWIATGDDGDQGTATRHELRYSTSIIDETNFPLATLVEGLADPRPAGSEEQARVTGLQHDTTYYFAVRAFDEFANASPLSNIATGTTAGAPSIAAAPGSFSAELFTGQTATRTLTLDNSGTGEYVYSIQIERVDGAGSAPIPFTLEIRDPQAPSTASNVQAQSYGPTFDPPTTPVPRADFQTIAGAADGLRIMILQSGADASQIRSQLAVMDGVTLVDELDVRQAAPALEDLTPFDAVIFIANNPVTDQVTVGNVLADYADAGGGVVMTLATLIDGWEVRGRFLEEGYYPVDLGPGALGASTLGDFDPEHPIMQGITEAQGDLLGDVSLANGAELVASWDNGEPFVATKGGNVAAINIYVAGNGFWAGDIPEVLRNAVLWTSNTIDWLSAEPKEGAVPAGSTREVDLIFDAGGIGTGSYRAEVVLLGNDPDEPILRMPAELTVTGAPDLDVAPSNVDFGSLFLGDTNTRFLAITNTGTQVATISDIASNNADFSAAASSLQVEPGQLVQLAVTYAPTAQGPAVGTLTFTNDDPDEGTITVDVTGTGLLPPELVATPGSFSADLFTGEIATDTLVVTNDGGSQLDVQLSVQLVNAQGVLTTPPDFVVGTPQILSTQSITADPTPAGAAGPPGIQEDLSQRAATQVFGQLFEFNEDFEDGDFLGWNEEQNVNIKEVTDETAANGTTFSYHQINFIPGHFNGVARSFGVQRPSYASFYVRSSDTTKNDAYFVIRAQNGLESIFFFARDTGVFYCNQDVGGNSSVPYEADTWYFIEFRDINFDDRTFDYYVNGALIQENISLRNTLDQEEFWEVDLYNFDDDTEAFWDEILIADEAPALPVDVGPQTLSLAPGESADVSVTFNASGLSSGEVQANIALNSNDPLNAQLLIPATLTVRDAADIDVFDTRLEWGSVFIGQSEDRALEIENKGFETLNISDLAVDDPAYSLSDTSLVLEPGQAQEIAVTFAPVSAGEHPATLSIISDDLDEPLVTVALEALALIPPEIEVTPLSFAEELFTGELSSQTMTLTNVGGSDLVFDIRLESEDVPDPSVSLDTGAASDDRFTTPSAGISAAGVPFSLDEDFEDGDFFGWNDAGGTALKEVTDETAANGTNFSYHERNAAGGHFTGIYRPLPSTRPIYVGFYIRPGSETTPDAYVALRDANGFEGIFFFAGPDGNFGINSNVGGDQSVAYTAHTWYHIEFKQINWDTKTFDYFVNGQLIQELVPFRNPSLIGSFSRIDLYSFQPGAEAWWDEIEISTEEPANPVGVNPIGGVIPAGESMDVAINFNAKNLPGGDYTVDILIDSNVPDVPTVPASASLSVIEAADIQLTNDSLAFDPLFLGLSSQRTLRVINEGSAPLTVSSTSVDGADFGVDVDAFVLEPGSNRAVTVTFTPSVDGATSGTLTFASNDPDEPLVEVALSGAGVLPPEIGVDPANLVVELFTGQRTTVPLTLVNSGSSGLTWQVAFPGDLQPHWLTIEPTAGTLAGPESMVLSVDLSAVGLPDADLTTEILFQSNDPDNPTLSVPVALQVTGAPDLRLSEDRLDFGDVFLDTSRNRRLIVSNDGVEELVVSKVSVDNLDFTLSTSGFTVAPGGGAEIVVNFAPPGLGSFTGALTLVTNDPDFGVIAVPLEARGALPPVAEVNPLSMSADLLSGELDYQTLTLSNSGGSPLTYSISVEERLELQPAAPTLGSAAGTAPWIDVFPRSLTAPETSGPPVPIVTDAVQLQAGPVFLVDDFEDGDFDGWEEGLGEGVRLVTDATAADETRFSYQETLSSIGHLDGVHQVFGPAQPGYIGFWVRSGDEAAEDAYFVVRDSQGLEVIWFFARSTGRFYVNADVGGDELVAYNQDTWYHIEFRNINFFSQRFDYYLNGQRIKANIPFRNFGGISEMSRIDLYNFTEDSEAWWDQIKVTTDLPFTAVSILESEGSVPVDGQADINVRFDARGLNGGEYAGDIVINTNDPERQEIRVPADVSVTGIPDIGPSARELDFEDVRLGLPETLITTITNFGTDLLVVDDVSVPHAEYSANRTAFELKPLESTAIAVTFNPQTVGLKEAVMTVSSNDPTEPQLEIQLTGSGIVAAKLAVNPGELQEEQYVGQMATQTLALTNEGGEPLNYSLTLDQLSAATIPPEIVLTTDDFESGPNGWTTVSYSEEDLWHLTDVDANSPEHSWWCSQPDAGHYATPYAISNAVISPPIDLRGLQVPIALSFYEDYETEPGWDKCMVDVSTDGGDSWIPLRGDYNTAPSGSTEGWTLQFLDLSAFADQIVRVRFYFETLDATNNAFRGWRFDDIKVTSIGVPWLDATPLEGTIEGSTTQDVVVTFNALQGRPPGLYEAAIDIASNDPGNPVIQVPVSMNVLATPRIGLPGDMVTLDSSIELAEGPDTRHQFEITAPPVSDAAVQLEASGNYDDPTKTATVTAEAFILGAAGNVSEECGTAIQSFPISDAQLRSLASDGVVEMDVKNSPQVGTCAASSHTLQLTYRTTRETLELGEADAGASATTLLEIVNTGEGELRISEIAADHPAIQITPNALDIPPMGRAEVQVTFAPTEAGIVNGQLSIASNDPVRGTISLAVTGEGFAEPAVAAIAPDTLVAALPPHSDRTRTKIVRLSNTGQADLDWNATMLDLGTVTPTAGTVTPGGGVDVHVTFASADLDEGDYQSMLTIDSNSTTGPLELPLTLHVRQTELQHLEVDFSPRYADSDDTIEVSVELDTAYDPHNVMVSSVLLNDCMLADSNPISYADLNRNGVLELILQFNEETFNECMPRNPPDGIHIVTVEGEIQDEAWFTGTAYLRGVVQVGK